MFNDLKQKLETSIANESIVHEEEFLTFEQFINKI
jgi:hypothetical protein